MAILPSDLLYKMSITSVSQGNYSGSSDQESLGGYISSTQIVGGAALNLFDPITGDENGGGVVDYRCFFIHNAHATLTLRDAVVWLSSVTMGGASVELAVDTTAASPIGAGSAQALIISNETTAPSGLGFAAPSDKAAGTVVGDIPAGYCKAIWVRRAAIGSLAMSQDICLIRVEGTTDV